MLVATKARHAAISTAGSATFAPIEAGRVGGPAAMIGAQLAEPCNEGAQTEPRTARLAGFGEATFIAKKS
jgi:hypothetical protein